MHEALLENLTLNRMRVNAHKKPMLETSSEIHQNPLIAKVPEKCRIKNMLLRKSNVRTRTERTRAGYLINISFIWRKSSSSSSPASASNLNLDMRKL
ncbi:hypothetical protein SAMN05216386_2101 [Nitrosospira briensis]|uniref:Uncharacterized protein n=1 Tax=Nitrosospira briensis TaxID=35799 RepID=A0A1I5CQL4_9PROT|nr:hypothetical protein SAMN05216386_2101 [Nitrosospira briensis]